jgi:hypothetical protein
MQKDLSSYPVVAYNWGMTQNTPQPTPAQATPAQALEACKAQFRKESSFAGIDIAAYAVKLAQAARSYANQEKTCNSKQ